MSLRRRIHLLAALALLSVLPLILGCASGDPYFTKVRSDANVYVAPRAVAIEKVAVLPFRAPTELIGSSVSDLFVTEMLRAGRYELVERSQMAKVLSETELAMAGLSSSAAAEVGNMIGADGVIIGTVDEYGTVAQRGRSYAVVGISFRLIECESGKVMWSVDLAKRSESYKTTLPEHGRDTVHEMTAGLYQKWHVQRKIRRKHRPPPARASSRSYDRPEAEVPMYSESPPPVPADFELSDMGLREVKVTWGDSSGSPAVYVIEKASAHDGPFDAIARVPYRKKQYIDRGKRGAPLKDSTVYYYRLTAHTAKGTASGASRVKESMTAPPPEPPTKLRAEAPASRAARVTWEKSPSEDVVKYVVERAPGDDPSDIREVGMVSGLEFYEGGTPTSDLADSAEYLYRVIPINRVGSKGAPSKAVRVKTLPPPVEVEGFKAASREVRCVPLSWEASPEEDVVSYNIYRSGSQDGEFEQITTVRGRETTSYLDGGFDPGNLEDETKYFYLIQAENSVTAEGEESAIISAVTREPPPAVVGVAGESYLPREIRVSWKQSPDEKVIGYIIERARETPEDFIKVTTVSGLDSLEYLDRGPQSRSWFGGGKSSSIGNLKDGTEYHYRVTAFNTARVESESSEPAAATTKFAPEIPAEVATTTNLPKTVEISWEENPETDIDRYVIETSVDGYKFKPLINVSADDEDGLVAIERGLRDNDTRHYRVKAIDADTLESEWCESVEGGTKPLPDPPTDLSVEFASANAIVSWAPPTQPDIVEYRVWKKGMFGATPLGTTEETRYELIAAAIGKCVKVHVTAIDEDELESKPSKLLEVRP